jgi:hypothetical protein
MNKKDVSICDQIENQNNKTTCMQGVAIEAQDVEICKKIDGSYINKARCINGVAGKANDTNICYEHEDRDDRYTCISIVAEDNNNLSLCDEISDQEEREGCVKDIARKKRDETLCEGLEEIMRDLCYSQVAEAKNDVNICDKTKDGYFRSECYKNVGAKTGEMDLCLSMNVEESYRQACLMEVSKRGDSSDACKRLEGDDLYNCALNVAKYQRNARYCGLAIASQGTREKCIHEVVSKYKDAKVCEPITDPGDKEKCMNSLKFVE